MTDRRFHPLLSLHRRLRPAVQPPRRPCRPGSRKPTRPTTSRSWARTPTASRSPSPASPRAISCIESKENGLVVKGAKAPESNEKGREFLHRGIAERAFELRFQLAEYVEVSGASLENGLLHVELKRELPESKKARTIAINGVAPKAIETAGQLSSGHGRLWPEWPSLPDRLKRPEEKAPIERSAPFCPWRNPCAPPELNPAPQRQPRIDP